MDSLGAVFVVALLETRLIGSCVAFHPSTMKSDGDLAYWIVSVSKQVAQVVFVFVLSAVVTTRCREDMAGFAANVVCLA